MKKCGICHTELPLNDFGKWNQSKDGLKPYCRECLASQRRKKRQDAGQKTRIIAPSVIPNNHLFCSKCEKLKPLSEFRSQDVKKHTARGWCKECLNSYQREKAQALGAKPKRTRDESLLPLGLKECFRCFQIKPVSNFSVSTRGYGGVAAYCKPCTSEYAMRDKAAHAANVKKWRDKSPLYHIQHSAHMLRRRARKKSQDTGLVTTAFIRSLYNQEICTYCHQSIDKFQRTIDHIKPLNKGGLHHPDNLAMCCRSCNSSKGDTDLITFLERKDYGISGKNRT